MIKVKNSTKEIDKLYFNCGMKVTIYYNECWSENIKFEILNNVTEIHYNFESVNNQIAFESDIHDTGLIRKFSDIKEFETDCENTIKESF